MTDSFTALTLAARSKRLRQAALATDALSPRDPHRGGHVWSERREALQLLEQLETMTETMAIEFAGLESRVFELAGLAVPSPNGRPWLNELPVAHRSKFFQLFFQLVRWMAERSRYAQTANPHDTNPRTEQ